MLKKLLNIFHQLSAIISRTNDFPLMLSQFVDVLADGLEVDVCSVYMFDRESNELVLKASHGLNPESINNVKMKPDEGLTGLCFTSEKMINIVNPDKHSQFKYFVNTGEERYKSFLAAPIVSGKEKLGVIVIQGRSLKRFNKSVTDSIKSISTQLSNVMIDAALISSMTSDFMSSSKESTAQGKTGAFAIKGKSANIGLGIGKACLFDNDISFDKIVHTETEIPEEEIKNLENAIKLTKSKTLALEQKALSLISEADASIFCAHLLFLEDKMLINKIKDDILKNKHTAEFSIKVVFEEYQSRFASMKESIFKEKVMDLKDVMLRLLDVVKNLKRGTSTEDISINLNNSHAILVVKEILPSALIRLPVENVCGIVCEKGGASDHVAILAKALNIPAIRGIKDITNIVNDFDDIIVDGHTELVHIRPDKEVKEHFKKILQSHNETKNIIETDSSSITLDSFKFTLKANIALISETSLLKKYGAEGIGLYRTEFLYMIRDHEPTEEEQFNIFKRIIENAEDLEVTIRVLDIGGDKPLPYISLPKEDNPALGNRGIRLLLSKKSLFKTHLKAILRAGAFGKIKVLFPMVSNVSEIDSILEIISEVETELQLQGTEFADDYGIGVMLEVPSLLFDIDSILKKVDFLSLGTNDLVQYLFASDRLSDIASNKNLYFSPVFLNILKNIGEVMERHEEKSISVCGEMAGDIFAAPLLMATGIKEYSMAPRFIPRVRKVIRAVTLVECCKLFEKALTLKDPDQVYALVENFYRNKFGDNFVI